MKKPVRLLFVVTMLFLFGMTFPMLACWGPDCDPCWEGDWCTIWECDTGEECCEDGYGDGECCDEEFCCNFACRECCPSQSSQCSLCKTCQNYTCQDDDNECVGCESCNNGTCEDDDDNCNPTYPYCVDTVCEKCKVDGDCDTCQRCNQTTHVCEDVEVTGISGVSGEYYKGSEETVTATVSGGTLPDNGCTIEWGGDATFSNQSGLTATATLDTCGTYLTITAETGVQSSPEESDPFTVAEIVQFHAKGFPTFPKCQNNSIGKNDFVINVNPDVQSIKDDVTVNLPDGTSIPPETHKAYATLWGKPDTPLEAAYDVIPDNGTIDCGVAPPYSLPSSTIEGPVVTETTWGDPEEYSGGGYQYKTKITGTAGTISPAYGNISEWIPCGATGQWAESTGIQINGEVGFEIFDVVDIEFGFTYQTSSSVRVQISAPLGYDMAVKGYSYPGTITATASPYESRSWTYIIHSDPQEPCNWPCALYHGYTYGEWEADISDEPSDSDAEIRVLGGASGWVTGKRCTTDCTE